MSKNAVRGTWSKLGTFGRTFVCCFVFYFVCKTLGSR